MCRLSTLWKWQQLLTLELTMEARSLFHPGKQSPKNMVSPIRQAAILLVSNQFYQGQFKSVTCFSPGWFTCQVHSPQSIHITSMFPQVHSMSSAFSRVFTSQVCFPQVDSHVKCILQSIHITSMFSPGWFTCQVHSPQSMHIASMISPGWFTCQVQSPQCIHITSGTYSPTKVELVDGSLSLTAPPRKIPQTGYLIVL
jgi:hypothetical protein